MFCIYCGAKVADNAIFCMNCGKNIRNVSRENREENAVLILKIVRAEQWYVINPPIQIIVDGGKKYFIENGSSINISIMEGRHKILFSCAMRKKSVDINIVKNTALYVKFNRITGGIQVENYVSL